MKSCIFIENIKIYAHHGVLPQERIVGNDYTVNVKVTYDFSKAAVSDNIADTISYADLYDIIEKEMNIPSNLLENVAWRIVRSIRNKYDSIREVELKVSKLNPPIKGDIGSASVLLID